MDSSARQQAYDRGNTIFSPDGRLYQVEYAREAVERGSPSLGIRTEEGVVLAAYKPVRSPLLESRTVEKIHRVDDHVAIASAGHAADARQLVEFAREGGQRHRLRYGEPIGVESLTKSVADHVQEYTQTGGSRPYGTALLVAGFDAGGSTHSKSASLFEVDPSGTPYGWHAAVIGNGSEEIQRVLEDRLEGEPADSSHSQPRTISTPATVDEGIETALEALETTVEDDLLPSNVDVYTVESESASITRYSNERIGAMIDR